MPGTAEEITDVNYAQSVLDVDRSATVEEIETAFEQKAATADGEQYWKLVKSREVAVAGSIPYGTAAYTVLRENPHTADITSLSRAAELLCAYTLSSDSTDEFLRETYEYVRDRIETFVDDPTSRVCSQTVQAVDVCYHALEARDIRYGKQRVLGSESTSLVPKRITGWEYSLDPSDDTEYYINREAKLIIGIKPIESESKTGYTVCLSRDGTRVDTQTHSRYGNAKRQAKRWIVEQSE